MLSFEFYRVMSCFPYFNEEPLPFGKRNCFSTTLVGLNMVIGLDVMTHQITVQHRGILQNTMLKMVAARSNCNFALLQLVSYSTLGALTCNHGITLNQSLTYFRHIIDREKKKTDVSRKMFDYNNTLFNHHIDAPTDCNHTKSSHHDWLFASH